VKAGHLSPSHIRDLRGVLDREAAQIGVLISFEEPTSGMRGEAASAGFYDSPRGRYPRIQIRTISDLLAGRGIQYPPEPATVYRPTLFTPEEVPAVAKAAKRRPRVPVPAQAGRAAVPLSPIAGRVREQFVRANREVPRSPRTSTRDRTAPLPLPGSADTD
jgi:hypothetical protein